MTDYAQHGSEEFPHIYQKGSEQYNFVRYDLARSAVNPEIDWIIVSHHLQKYAFTQENILPGADEWSGAYHPLFGEYNVDLVLQGNQHNYQRTFPINYNKVVTNQPNVTDRNIINYSDPSGQIFATVGTAGAQLHDLDWKAPYISTQHIGYGFLEIGIIDKGRILNATFYANDGSIKDQLW